MMQQVSLWSTTAVDKQPIHFQYFLGFSLTFFVGGFWSTLYKLLISRKRIDGWTISLAILFILCQRFSFSSEQSTNILYMYTPACYLHIIFAMALADAWAAPSYPDLSAKKYGTAALVMETLSDAGNVVSHYPKMSHLCSLAFSAVIVVGTIMSLQLFVSP